jgi:HrpA-like RNA helicase
MPFESPDVEESLAVKARWAMTDFPEPDQPREQALQAAIQDLAVAAVDSKASDEELVAAMEPCPSS